MNQPIRVIVVDDSALMRRVITGLLEQDPDIRVVGTAANGREAIGLVEALRPDIVTMDVRMPVMDGLETTEYLMAYCPTPILVLTASLARHEVDITFKMLGAGALEVFEKPAGGDAQALARAGQALIKRVKVLARVKVVTHLRGRRRPGDLTAPPPPTNSTSNSVPRPATGAGLAPGPASGAHTPLRNLRPVAPPPMLAPPLTQFPVIVIGASTGGPRVIYQILAGLPLDLPAAVLVVQHIAEGFSAGMAEWLSAASQLPVRLAVEDELIAPGVVLVAPDQRDLMIVPGGRVHLNSSPLLLQRPAIDVTMQAAAEAFGARTIGVLLTGMGRDGAYGLLTIRRANGHTIAQDEESCTIYGMPRAAVQLEAAREVLAPPQIAPRLIELVSQKQRAALTKDRR